LSTDYGAQLHGRIVAQLTKRREPKAKSYMAMNHWNQHTLYESPE
jgi:hypothetical protein